jgi:hypothetical protein
VKRPEPAGTLSRSKLARLQAKLERAQDQRLSPNARVRSIDSAHTLGSKALDDGDLDREDAARAEALLGSVEGIEGPWDLDYYERGAA